MNPKTYVSPSGEYRLHVDPSTMYGQGNGTYRLTRGDQVVWEGERPYTLWEAGVTDDGVVAGYAYSLGWRGFPRDKTDRNKPESEGYGDFRVVILDRDGKARLDHVEKRQASRFLHTPPKPLAEGMFVDAENDRLVIRMTDDDVNQRISAWRVYRLSDGKRIAEVRPRHHLSGVPRFCDDFAARPVRGTPLALVHWWLFDDRPGGKFTLVGLDGKPVWTLDLPGDYVVAGDQQAEWRLRDQIRERGAILRCDEPRRFELWHVAAGQRVSYEVRPNAAKAGAWEVVETARGPHAPASPVATQLSSCRAEHLGTIRLGDPPATRAAIRDVGQLAFDAAGRIGFVRRAPDGAATFVRVTPSGSVEAELPVAEPADARARAWYTAWLRDDRWIVIGAGPGNGPPQRALRVDVDSQEVRELPAFDCPTHIKRLVSDRHGGFVVLVEGEFDKDGVIAFDGEGGKRWRVPREHSGRATLVSPADVAVTTDGQIAVVCSFHKLVQLYDQSGKHVRRIALKDSFTRPPVYPSELASDRDGGLIVGDCQCKPPIWRITAYGKLIGVVEPKFADGRTFPLHYGVQAAPDGRLWTTDGSSLLRLDDKGVVDLVLGAAPAADCLGDVAAMTVDRQGRVYLVSSRTCAVHVFDRTGARLRVCKPAPDDFRSNPISAAIAVADDGEVFVNADGPADRAFLRFAADGRRVGFLSTAEAGPGGEWRFKPGGHERWTDGFHRIYLVGADGKPRRTVERRPDGNWLENVYATAVAPDGSLAAVACDSLRFAAKPVVNVYTPAGDPLAAIALPSDEYVGRLAFNGSVVVFCQGDRWFVLDVATRVISTLDLAQTESRPGDWHCFFAGGGDELWMCDPRAGVVEHFRTPTCK